jgi:hypothetical protein
MVDGVAFVNNAADIVFNEPAVSEEPAASMVEATANSSSARSVWIGPVRKLKIFGTCVAAMSLWAACAGGFLIAALASGHRTGEVDPDLES